jgi:hypothetical protein
MTDASTVLPSTLFLTVLLGIGLFFFIRASTKDRIEELRWFVADPEDDRLRDRLRTYFASRAYRVIATDPERNSVTFEGWVRPSVGLAVFLTGLAAVGLLCLGLVVALTLPQLGPWPLGLAAIAPIAGGFYWRRSGRLEQVQLRIEAAQQTDAAAQQADGTSPRPSELQTETGGEVVAIAHRDELAALRSFLNLPNT